MSITDNNAGYRLFCTSAPADFPVFMQDWYLDAACDDGTWHAAISEKQGKIIGVWPYFVKKKGIWEYVAMPKLGKFMGPYIVPEYRQISSEMRILQDLLAQIPKGLAAFEQDCNYTFQNWVPMYWQGFSQTTRYSYTIDLIKPLTAILAAVENNYRGKINKASAALEVRYDCSLDDLFDVSMLSFSRQGLKKPFSLAYFKKIHAAFETHNACKKIFVTDRESGAIYSAGYLVWDQSTAYSYLGGDDPQYRSSGSGILMYWEKIRFAQEILQVQNFDFMGSMLKNVEQSRRHFGAVQRPYFRLRREWSPLWKWGKALLR